MHFAEFILTRMERILGEEEAFARTRVLSRTYLASANAD